MPKLRYHDLVERDRMSHDRDTPLMAQTLEAGLARLWGRAVRIRQLRREVLSTSSSFRTERLRVSIDGDKPLRVFFKDMHPGRLMPLAQRVRESSVEAGHRELRMYQSVLSPERFGTLHLYAARWEPEQGRHWFFLEDAGRTRLHDYTDMPRWTAAARWAARFHAATRGLPDTQTRFLPRYDQEHYRRCADRVERLLPSLDTHQRTVVDRGLALFAERIAWLSALPQCVIHGEYFGENIMLRRANGRGRRGHRIVVIDWETAAVGPGTFDLVSMSAGKWTIRQREAMRAAYAEEFQRATGLPLNAEAFRQELAGVALYQALQWLTWWGCHRRSKHFTNFMRELRGVLDDNFARPVSAAASLQSLQST